MLSYPGTAPAFYNYLKGGRPLDPGMFYSNGTLVFGHQVSQCPSASVVVSYLPFLFQYVLNSPIPLWSFGYGLSYTNFTYSNLRLSSQKLSKKGTLTVTVNVKNEGSVAGKEVVQVYLTDVFSSVVTPNQFLAGFNKTKEISYVPFGSKYITTLSYD